MTPAEIAARLRQLADEIDGKPKRSNGMLIEQDGFDGEVIEPDSEAHKKMVYAIARRIGRPSAPTELGALGWDLSRIETFLLECESAADPKSYLAKRLRIERGQDQPEILDWRDRAAEERRKLREQME